MKIAPRAIAEFLAQPDRSAVGVLMYGPDEGLCRERLHLLAPKIIPGDDPFARVDLGADRLKADPALLADELASISLTGTRRLVVISAATDAMAKVVETALPSATGANYLVVCAGELGPRSALRQLFEAQARLAALPCYHDEAMDVQNLIRQHFAAAGISCSRDALEYLSQHLGNDRGITMKELEKIVLYLGPERNLTLDAAEALVGHNRDVTPEALSFEMASGNLSALDTLLTQILREGAQPVALLRSAQRHFHRLYACREAMQQGKSAADAVAALKPAVFFRFVPAFVRQVETWKPAHIAVALERLKTAEQACKQVPLSPALLAGRALLGVAQMKRAG